MTDKHETMETPKDEASQEPVTEELQAHVDRLKRLQAEFENYKKRMARDLAAIDDRITDRVILDFLPLYDSLERAFDTYEADGNADTLVAGFEQIYAQFGQLLEKRGVTRIDCVGALFDPAQHEALLSVESEETKNTILEELSPGYVRDGRTLRASKVTVSRGPSEEAEEER